MDYKLLDLKKSDINDFKMIIVHWIMSKTVLKLRNSVRNFWATPKYEEKIRGSACGATRFKRESLSVSPNDPFEMSSLLTVALDAQWFVLKSVIKFKKRLFNLQGDQLIGSFRLDQRLLITKSQLTIWLKQFCLSIDRKLQRSVSDRFGGICGQCPIYTVMWMPNRLLVGD